MEKEEKIKVVYAEAGKRARVVEIGNSLDAMQGMVGGLIEACHYFDDHAVIVCNDAGWVLDMKPNRAIYSERTGEVVSVIPGNFVICHKPPDSEHFHSLPEELLKKYLEKFKYPEVFIRSSGKIVVFQVEPEKKKRDRRDERR